MSMIIIIGGTEKFDLVPPETIIFNIPYYTIAYLAKLTRCRVTIIAALSSSTKIIEKTE